jgi:hypothetical protein
MRRVVVALTTLLVVIGGAVVGGYLILFSDVADRASRAAPADTALYVNVYLQPSAGQQASLFGLIGQLPGFGDPATLEEKIDQVAGRFLGDAGIDYAADLRPWLGSQIALAWAPGEDGSAPEALLLAAVKDYAVARIAVPRLMDAAGRALQAGGVSFEAETFRGRPVLTSSSLSYALLDDLMVVASTPARLRAALEADADVAPSLADSPAFTVAMGTVAADHLGSIYLDLPRAAGLTESRQLGGYGTVGLAITAAADGLHLNGAVPFAADAASARARDAFALSGKPSTLAGWMPRTTSVEVTLFGVAQSIDELEATTEGVEALNQLRAIASLGFGINVDRDLLPLLDGEVAVALRSLDADGPRGQVLLRPSDPAAAEAALDRMRSGLVARGSRVTTDDVAGATVTTLSIPQIGMLAYAVLDGVVIVGLDPADVTAALEARAAGQTLAGDDRYGAPFDLVEAQSGHELWADVPSMIDGLAGIFDPGTELRDILHQIGEVAMSATAAGDRLEINGVLTVK